MARFVSGRRYMQTAPKQTFTLGYVVDALRKGSFSRTYAVDAIRRATFAKTYGADAMLAASGGTWIPNFPTDAQITSVAQLTAFVTSGSQAIGYIRGGTYTLPNVMPVTYVGCRITRANITLRNYPGEIVTLACDTAQLSGDIIQVESANVTIEADVYGNFIVWNPNTNRDQPITGPEAGWTDWRTSGAALITGCSNFTARKLKIYQTGNGIFHSKDVTGTTTIEDVTFDDCGWNNPLKEGGVTGHGFYAQGDAALKILRRVTITRQRRYAIHCYGGNSPTVNGNFQIENSDFEQSVIFQSDTNNVHDLTITGTRFRQHAALGSGIAGIENSSVTNCRFDAGLGWTHEVKNCTVTGNNVWADTEGIIVFMENREEVPANTVLPHLTGTNVWNNNTYHTSAGNGIAASSTPFAFQPIVGTLTLAGWRSQTGFDAASTLVA